MPGSVAKQAASRSISAPLAWQGKFRSDRGLKFGPTCSGQPNVVAIEPVSTA